MSTPAHTVLTDEEVNALCGVMAQHTVARAVNDRKLVRDAERIIIEKLGVSDAVPVAWLQTFTSEEFGYPRVWLPNQLTETDPRIWNSKMQTWHPLHDAAALAQARQQGYEEGRKAARDPETRKFVAQLEQEWSDLKRMRDNEYATVRQQGYEAARAELGPDAEDDDGLPVGYADWYNQRFFGQPADTKRDHDCEAAWRAARQPTQKET